MWQPIQPSKYCYRHFPRDYGLVVWLNAETIDTLITDFHQHQLLSNLANVDAAFMDKSSDETVEEVQTRLFRSNVPWLILFDNADRIAVDCFVPLGAGTKGHVLVTTRHVRAKSSGTLILGCLRTNEAIELLRRSAGSTQHGGSSNAAAAKDLCKKLGTAIEENEIRLARSRFHTADILYGQQFDSVDWEMVHEALNRVPRMFQMWACKQVMNIAPTNGNRPWEPDLCPLCPSCSQFRETCAHILLCNHSGRVETLMHSIDLLEQWLVEVDTDPDLRECLVEYARGRGGRTMPEICRGMDDRYRRVAEEQDAIGWRRFMEGMICRGLRHLQELYTTVEGSNVTGE